MDKNRSTIIITGAITIIVALLIGIMIPVMSDGARFGGNGSADLAPAVQATLAARQAEVDAASAPDLTLFTPTAQAVVAMPADTPVPAATTPPTAVPTLAPTEVPTEAPAVEPTLAPVAEATEAPVAPPTEAPAVEPTTAPVAEATAAPVAEPTAVAVAPVDTTPAIPGAGGQVTVTISAESGMNVRSGPSTETTALTALPTGAVVPAVGRSADSQWIQIFLADLKANGWVFASLVTIEGDVAALPIAE